MKLHKNDLLIDFLSELRKIDIKDLNFVHLSLNLVGLKYWGILAFQFLSLEQNFKY